jgi:hypothetical protein
MGRDEPLRGVHEAERERRDHERCDQRRNCYFQWPLLDD